MLMIEPPLPCSRMRAAAARVQRKAPPTLTRRIRRNSSGSRLSSRKFEKTPALLTSTSRRPNSATALATRSATSCSSETSPTVVATVRPAPASRAPAASSRSLRRSARRTAAPASASRRGVPLLERLHRELEAPCTFFVCGRTLLHALDALEPLADSELFDIQQHTYSHVVFRDVRYRPTGGDVEAVLPETPHVAIQEELAITSDLIRKYLGRECVGLRTPFGYYRGLRDRPDLLRIVQETGHRYVTSWGRNEQNGNPTPWVQPFTYEEEGFPDLLEIPFPFWLDGIWFDAHAYG